MAESMVKVTRVAVGNDDKAVQGEPATMDFGSGYGDQAKTQAVAQTSGGAKVLDSQKEAEAMDWYKTRNVPSSVIQKIQADVGASVTGTMDAEAVQSVGRWQKKKSLKKIDGKFGPKSAKKAGDTELYNELKTITDDYKSGKTSVVAASSESAPVASATETESVAQESAPDVQNSAPAVIGATGTTPLWKNAMQIVMDAGMVEESQDGTPEGGNRAMVKRTPTDILIVRDNEEQNGEDQKAGSEETSSEDETWKNDLIAAGLKEDEIYTGTEELKYGHNFVTANRKYNSSGKYYITVGDEIKEGAATDSNAVKTLQALLNRALSGKVEKTAKADGSTIVKGGSLELTGEWDLNTATHLMYFIDMLPSADISKYIDKYYVKCDDKIWKALRDKADVSMSSENLKQSYPASNLESFTDDKSNSHKIVKGGAEAFNAMKEDCDKELKLTCSFRSFSSHGMADAGMGGKTGQMELFALRMAGIANKDSDAAVPTHSLESKSHMTGKAIDVKNNSDGLSWMKAKPEGSALSMNSELYGFTKLSTENWHFNFNLSSWQKQKPEREKRKKEKEEAAKRAANPGATNKDGTGQGQNH